MNERGFIFVHIFQLERPRHFGPVTIPAGAVYAELPPAMINGRARLRTVVWVENLRLARQNAHFVVYEMTAADLAPRERYVNGTKGMWAAIAEYIRALPVGANACNKGDVYACGPRDRRVPVYRSGRPERQADPIEKGYVHKPIPSKDATAGVKVGPVRLTTEGYYARLGVETY